jgi:hypothetical protein
MLGDAPLDVLPFSAVTWLVMDAVDFHISTQSYRDVLNAPDSSASLALTAR